MGRAMGRTLKETYDITVGAIVFCESGLWGWFLLGQSSLVQRECLVFQIGLLPLLSVVFFFQQCGVISEHTKKMCTR